MQQANENVIVMGLPRFNYNVTHRCPEDYDPTMFIDMVMLVVQLANFKDECTYQYGMLWDMINSSDEEAHPEYIDYITEAVMETAVELYSQIRPAILGLDVTYPDGFYIDDVLIKPDGMYGKIIEC
jgi:hypothetical protein